MAGYTASFFRFLERSRWFNSPLVLVLLSSVMLMVVEYLTRVRFVASPLVAYSAYWAILTAALLLMTELAAARLRHEEDRLMVSIFVAGLVMGLAVAVYKAAIHRELWTLFNILAEPMRTALVGLVIAWLYLLRDRAASLTRLSSERL